MSNRTAQHRNPHAPRDPRIEALRLVAIAGVAIFHTFQTWFAAATDGSWATGPVTLTALGCISLLGAYGNHVFFLISGLFLVPRAARTSRENGYWRAQVHRTARRALVVLASVALYAAFALLVSTFVTPLDGVSLHESNWLVGGLEFIWVYLVLVAATPVMGWVWARVRRPHVLVGVLVTIVLAINLYIAFVSPGGEERGLLEWRKLMSAVSYLTAFLVGGMLGERRCSHPARWLAVCVIASVALEETAAALGARDLMVALSFKSTSPLSFALAVASVRLATDARTDTPVPASRGSDGRASALVCRITPSILGFYIAQSLFSPLWRPAVEALTQAAAPTGGAALLATGVAASLTLLAALLAVDQVMRLPLLRRLGLA